MARSFGQISHLCQISLRSYYFLAAMGPQYKKYLWWKRYLTRLQVRMSYLFLDPLYL